MTCAESARGLDCFTAEAFRELATYRRRVLRDDLLLAAIALGSYGLVLFILWAL